MQNYQTLDTQTVVRITTQTIDVKYNIENDLDRSFVCLSEDEGLTGNMMICITPTNNPDRTQFIKSVVKELLNSSSILSRHSDSRAYYQSEVLTKLCMHDRKPDICAVKPDILSSPQRDKMFVCTYHLDSMAKTICSSNNKTTLMNFFSDRITGINLADFYSNLFSSETIRFIYSPQVMQSLLEYYACCYDFPSYKEVLDRYQICQYRTQSLTQQLTSSRYESASLKALYITAAFCTGIFICNLPTIVSSVYNLCRIIKNRYTQIRHGILDNDIELAQIIDEDV